VRVEWRPLAEQDLAEIVQYIAADSPRAAYDVHDRIRDRVGNLSKHPKLGRPGRVKATRELVVTGTPFLVAYRIEGEIVTILRVLHGARRWPKSFQSS
jgi:toxin ParE1/3/4